MGGVVFALIQILQQTVGAFDPRPVVSLLVAVTVGLAGLALQRGRHVAARSGVLRGLLHVWPLRRIADVDPLTLGVFPPADAGRGSSLGPYVARDADDAVREALGEGGLVVLVGPERAGKSRTACEVARDSFGDRPAVVPASGTALAALLDDPSFTPPRDALWWLDDLERFAPHLNAPELAVLLDGRTVVTTVRPQAWEELLRGSGDVGERGRRLAAAARVIALPAALSAAEADRARELYSDSLDLTRGLAAALGAAPAPATPEAPAPTVREREREATGDRVFVLGLGATAASALVLALVVNTGGWAKPVAPPVSAQLDAIRQAAEREGSATVFASVEDLHGVSSHVFVLAPRDGTPTAELRIYDEDDGWLRLRFSFRPRTRGGDGGYAVVPPEDLQGGDWDYDLGRPRTVDIDGDGNSELVATYQLTVADEPIKVPVVIAWDDYAQRYAISAALPALQPPIPGWLGAYFVGAYTLADARTGTRLRAGAVSEFRIVRDQRLIAARAIQGRGPARLAVTVYVLRLSRGRVTPVLSCTGRENETVRIVATGHRSAQRVLAAVATKADAKRSVSRATTAPTV